MPRTLLSILSIFVFFTSFSGTLFAQSNDWLPGYVVTNQGDTLYGQVRDRDTGPFGGLYDKIRLKADRGGKRRYSPRQISSYQRGNARFVTLRIVSRTNFFKTETWVTDEGGEPRFYQVIAEGPLTLYHQEYTDDDNSMILDIPFFKREDNPRLVRATQGLFGLKKKLLADFFSDRPELVDQIQSGALTTPMQVWEAY